MVSELIQDPLGQSDHTPDAQF